MRNVSERQLKKAIFMDAEDFIDLAREEACMDLTVDEYGIDREDDFVDDYMQDLICILSNYFDVEITSIHTDNCESMVGVWLVYKD